MILRLAVALLLLALPARAEMVIQKLMDRGTHQDANERKADPSWVSQPRADAA